MGFLDDISTRAAAIGQREEQRVIGGVPWRPWDNPYWRFDVGGPVHPSRRIGGIAGYEAALRLAAVYSSVKFLADGVAQLPIEQFRNVGEDKISMPLGRLLESPSAVLNPFDWKFQYAASVNLHGTAWGYITQRDSYGYPISVEWLPPEDMVVTDPRPYNPARVKIYFAGKPLTMDELFIVRAFTVPGRTAGLSPMALFQSLIESGLDALEFGGGWFRSGGVPPGTFQNTQYEVSDEQTVKVRRKLMDAQRKHEPLVYGRDWEYKPITIPPEAAQFIQSQQLTATQIAAVYGVRPDRVGGTKAGSMTYSNVEMDMLSEVVDSLDPWLVRLETALLAALPSQQFARFNRDARLRMTTENRWNLYEKARNIGAMNVQEIRKAEHMKPLPEPKQAGDYDGADYTPLLMMIAAARGAKALLGEDENNAAAAAAATPGKPAAPVQPALPGMPPLAPIKLPAVNGARSANGNGHRDADDDAEE